MERTCSTCFFWGGAPSSVRGRCGLDAAYGDPAFDDGCTQHRPTPTVEPPTVVSPPDAAYIRQLVADALRALRNERVPFSFDAQRQAQIDAWIANDP